MKTNCLLSPGNYHDLWKYFPGPTEIRIYIDQGVAWKEQTNPYIEQAFEPQFCQYDQWTITWPAFEQNSNGEVTAFWNYDIINDIWPNEEINLSLPEGGPYTFTCLYPIEQLIDFAKTVPILRENDSGQMVNYFSPYFHDNWYNAYYREQFFRQAFCIYNDNIGGPYYILPRNSVGESAGYTGPSIDDLPQKFDCYNQRCIEIPLVEEYFAERRFDGPDQLPFILPIIPCQPFNDGFWELHWPDYGVLAYISAI